MANGYLRSLLGEDEYEQARGGALNNAMLMAGLQGLMASGPSLTPTSLGQILGQAGMAGLEGYQGGMQQAERQALQGMELSQMRQEQEAEEAFKNALPKVFQNGRINYQELQKLALVYPERVGQLMTAYKSAQPPQAPSVNLQFDPKTGTIFNPRTGEVRRAEGFAETVDQPPFTIPEGATPQEEASIYRQQARKIAPTDSQEAKRLNDLADEAEKRGAAKTSGVSALPANAQKQVSGIDATIKAADELINLYKDFSRFSFLNPTQRVKLNSAVRNLQLQAKEAYNLGVLNGPDLELMESIIIDPLSTTGWVAGQEGLISNIQQFKDLMGTSRKSIFETFKTEPSESNGKPKLRFNPQTGQIEEQ